MNLVKYIALFFIIIFCKSSILSQTKSDTAKDDKGKSCKLFLTSALIFNNSFSNITRGQMNAITKTNKNNDSPISFGYNFGLGLIFGKKLFLKHTIGVNICVTNSILNYEVESRFWVQPFSTIWLYSKYNIYKNVVFLNIEYGMQFNLKKGLNVSFFPSFNIPLSTISQISFKQALSSAPYDTSSGKYVKNEINDTVYLSLKLKIGYNFTIKKQMINVFLTRNIGALNLKNISNNYWAPWWMIGIEFIPTVKEKNF